MDDRALRKLAAAAEHERTVADLAAAAVTSAQAKVEKVDAEQRAAVDVVRGELAEAEAVAEETALRADAADQAYRDAADGQSVTVAAQAATASGKAS